MDDKFRVDVLPGEEILETVTKSCAERGVANAAIVSLIGAVSQITISNMRHDDDTAIKPLDDLTTIDAPCELQGVGEVVEGVPHAHVTLSLDANRNTTIGGHLHRARVGRHFVHVYLVVFPG